jgi:retron-type reverse transcriptase
MRVEELPGYLKQHWPVLREQLRSAHQAVAKAQQYIAAGNRWVVDLDLEKIRNVHHRLLDKPVQHRRNTLRRQRAGGETSDAEHHWFHHMPTQAQGK